MNEENKVESMVDIDMSGLNKLADAIRSLVEDFHKNGLVVTCVTTGQGEAVTIQIQKGA